MKLPAGGPLRRCLNKPMSISIRCLLCLSLLMLAELVSAKPLSIIDDTGARVDLQSPAKRVIVLTPHIAEILLAIGARDRIVGFVKTDGEAIHLPKAVVVGTLHGLNIEKIIALKPDLIIAWGFMPISQKNQLAQLKIPVFVSDPKRLSDIGSSIEKTGHLLGLTSNANRLSREVQQQLNVLKMRYQSRRPVRVLMQVWLSPLISIGNQSILNDAIHVCRGENIFSDQSQPAFSASMESVIVRNPEVIVATLLPEQKPAFLNQWRRWPRIQAVKNEHLYLVDTNRLSRPSHLLLQGLDSLCQTIDNAR